MTVDTHTETPADPDPVVSQFDSSVQLLQPAGQRLVAQWLSGSPSWPLHRAALTAIASRRRQPQPTG